jgi:ribosomal protein L7/L12
MMPIMLIILAVIVAVVLILIIANGAGSSASRQVHQPADMDWDVVDDAELQAYLEKRQKIQAIKRYRELSGSDLKSAKEAVEYLLAQAANPDWLEDISTLDQVDTAQDNLFQVVDADDRQKKPKRPPTHDLTAGIRDMLMEGRTAEAVEIYRKFTGVDQYTAQDAIAEIERELRLSDEAGESVLSPADADTIRDLLAAGDKVEAIKRYRELTGAGLQAAKDAVDGMERGLNS